MSGPRSYSGHCHPLQVSLSSCMLRRHTIRVQSRVASLCIKQYRRLESVMRSYSVFFNMVRYQYTPRYHTNVTLHDKVCFTLYVSEGQSHSPICATPSEQRCTGSDTSACTLHDVHAVAESTCRQAQQLTSAHLRTSSIGAYSPNRIVVLEDKPQSCTQWHCYMALLRDTSKQYR